MYSCVTAMNYLWLYSLLRLIQHFLGVGVNTAYSNIAFVNMPNEDQTNYIAFHTVSTNIAAFLGMMAGTLFVGANPDILLHVGGLAFGNVQILLWVQAFGEMLVPLLLLLLLKKIQPGQASCALHGGDN